MNGLAELDALRCELEQAHRRAGDLARSEDLTLKEFGRGAHSQLTGLIRVLGETERVLQELAEIGLAKIPS